MVGHTTHVPAAELNEKAPPFALVAHEATVTGLYVAALPDGWQYAL